jgi:hypothetical protein
MRIVAELSSQVAGKRVRCGHTRPSAGSGRAVVKTIRAMHPFVVSLSNLAFLKLGLPEGLLAQSPERCTTQLPDYPPNPQIVDFFASVSG